MNNKERYLQKLHNELLLIMDEIDRICVEHDLKYYLIGGSLLGAIRHKGFIPWDDDLDICMPREDFNQFVQMYYKELQSPFSLKWINTDEKYWFPFAKVENNRTIFQEEQYVGIDSTCGIFVDIFPIDITDGYSKGLVRRQKKIRLIQALMHSRVDYVNDTGLKKFVKFMASHLFSNVTLNSKLVELMMLTDASDGDYYTNFGSQYGVKKQTMPKEYYSTGVMLAFEDRFYRAPDEYEKVLGSIFGEDYMQLPPEEKRVTHCPTKVCFSDGEVMKFNK